MCAHVPCVCKSVCVEQCVGQECVCGEQFPVASTQGWEKLSLEPSVGESVSVKRQKAVDHAVNRHLNTEVCCRPRLTS